MEDQTKANTLTHAAASNATDAANTLKQMGVTLNNGSPFIIDSGKVKFADVKLASIYASKTEVEDLRQEVAHLKSLYQEVFLMAARAVSDIADAADTDGAE